MKQVRYIAAVLILLVSPVSFAGAASADSISSVQQIQVTARVLPMRHIFIDRSGTITEITSNTASEVVPEVFLGTDIPSNRIQLTHDIEMQYRKLVPLGTGKAGILYNRPAVNSTSANIISLMTAHLH